MSLKSEDIFMANWSYRKHEISALQVANEMSFPIVECLSCNFFYAKYLPNIDFLNVIYDVVIDEVAARTSNFDVDSMAYRMKYLSALLRLLPKKQSVMSVLDFGCGFGPTLHLLDALPSIRAVGYENSSLRLDELASKNFNVTGNVAEIDASVPFAAIILDNVLEHIPDPFEALVQVRSWSDDSTIIYVSVPDANRNVMQQQREILSQHKVVAMDINPWEHLNYFDLDHLDKMMKKAGFLPLAQVEVPVEVSIGLRPERDFYARIKNAIASAMRLVRYVRTGNALCTTSMRYYRLADS